MLVVLARLQSMTASGAIRFFTDDMSNFARDRESSTESSFLDQRGIAAGEGATIPGSQLENLLFSERDTHLSSNPDSALRASIL